MLEIATCVCLMFAFTCANHLGMVSKIEDIFGISLQIINCPKCSTFWSTLIYMIVSTKDVIGAVAMSFFFAYLAIWTELAMCVIDYFYKRIYEKVISDTASDKATPSAGNGTSESTLSKLRKN